LYKDWVRRFCSQTEILQQNQIKTWKKVYVEILKQFSQPKFNFKVENWNVFTIPISILFRIYSNSLSLWHTLFLSLFSLSHFSHFISCKHLLLAYVALFAWIRVSERCKLEIGCFCTFYFLYYKPKNKGGLWMWNGIFLSFWRGKAKTRRKI